MLARVKTHIQPTIRMTVALTGRSLDESEALLKCSSDCCDLTLVVAVQHYAFIDINIIIS